MPGSKTTTKDKCVYKFTQGAKKGKVCGRNCRGKFCFSHNPNKFIKQHKYANEKKKEKKNYKLKSTLKQIKEIEDIKKLPSYHKNYLIEQKLFSDLKYCLQNQISCKIFLDIDCEDQIKYIKKHNLGYVFDISKINKEKIQEIKTELAQKILNNDIDKQIKDNYNDEYDNRNHKFIIDKINEYNTSRKKNINITYRENELPLIDGKIPNSYQLIKKLIPRIDNDTSKKYIYIEYLVDPKLLEKVPDNLLNNKENFKEIDDLISYYLKNIKNIDIKKDRIKYFKDILDKEIISDGLKQILNEEIIENNKKDKLITEQYKLLQKDSGCIILELHKIEEERALIARYKQDFIDELDNIKNKREIKYPKSKEFMEFMKYFDTDWRLEVLKLKTEQLLKEKLVIEIDIGNCPKYKINKEYLDKISDSEIIDYYNNDKMNQHKRIYTPFKGTNQQAINKLKEEQINYNLLYSKWTYQQMICNAIKEKNLQLLNNQK
jgi:hypothetical protein